MPPQPLTNFEIKRCFQNEPTFNGVYSRDNLTKIKDGAYVINLDENSDIGTHWVALYVQNDNVTYSDSFGVEHIPEEIKTFINRSLSTTTNIFRIQAYDSIMCEYFCIGFIEKFHISFSKERLLNMQNRIISKCRLENKHKLGNYKIDLIKKNVI